MMDVNWARAFNRLFEVINSEREAYFSGGRFLSTVREIDPYFPDYSRFMADRRERGESTSRKDYYYDVLMGFQEHDRIRLLNAFLDKIKHLFPDKVAALQDELGGLSAVPPARLSQDAWNAERLNRYLDDIDSRIGSGNYAGAVTLAYTCLEGFLKVFVKTRISTFRGRAEVISLSRALQTHLRDHVGQYPDEALNMLNHVAHTVDKARN